MSVTKSGERDGVNVWWTIVLVYAVVVFWPFYLYDVLRMRLERRRR